MICWFKLFKKYRNKQIQAHLLIWSVIVLILFFSLSVNSFSSEAPQVAVYYFHNRTGNEALQCLEEDLAVSIGQTLSKIEQMTFIPLSEIDKMADYQQYKSMIQKKDSRLFAQLANLLQVDLLFSGNYLQEKKDYIDLDLLMYLPSVGHLVEFRRMSATLDNLSDLKENIIKIILQEAGIDPDSISLESIIEADKDDWRIELTEVFVSEAPVFIPKEDSADSFIHENSLALEYYHKALELKERAILEYGGIDFPSKPLWNEAIQNASKAVEANPDFVEGYYLLYEIYQRTKWIAREIESLEQYIAATRRTNKPVSPQDFSELLARLAHLKYTVGDTTTAINYLEEAISHYPNNVDARTYLMEIYYDTGQGSKALKQAEEIKRIQPDSIELDWFTRRTQRINLYGREAFESYENGYNSYIAKKYQEAISYLEQAIRLAPAFKDAHYYLGLAYYHYGNLVSAMKHWEEAVRLDPFDTHSIIYLNKAIEEKEYGREAVWSFNEGYKHYVAGKYEEALVEFKRSINMNPNYDKARMFLMRTYYHLGQMEEYLEERKIIGEEIDFAGDWEKEYYQLAYNFFSLGEYSSALEKLQEALEVNSDYLEARFLIAETLYRLENYQEANLHYQYVIDNFMDSEYYDNALLGSGWCSYLLNDYEKSEKDLELLLEKFPRSSLYQEAVYKLGRVYFVQDKYEKVIDIYGELLRLDPLEYDISEIQFLLGQAYFWEENYDRSKSLLHNIIERDPRFELIDETRYFYSFSLFREKQYQEAMIMLEELTKKVDSQVREESLYLLGRVLLELKDYDRVITINQSLLEIDIAENMLEKVLFDLGLSYAREGKDQEAIIYFKRVIDEFPQGELANLSKMELAYSYFELSQYQDVLNILENDDSREALEIKLDSAKKLNDDNKLFLLYQLLEEKYPDASLTAEAYFSLAKSQYDNGDFREAIHTFKKMEGIIQLEKMTREVNYWQGLTYFRLGEYQQAENYFQLVDILAGDEIAIKSLYMLGETSYQQNNYRQAIQYYQDFLNHYSSHQLSDHVQYSIGWSYLNEDDYQNALTSFEMLVQEYSKSQFLEESHFLIGKIQFLSNFNSDSRINLKHFIEIYPDSQYHEEALYIIAQIDLEEQVWIDSITNFERLINQYPNSRYLPGALYGLCLSYFKKDEYKKALDIGERYLDTFSSGSFICDILYITAICEEELGNMNEASKKYENIILSCAESPYIDSAKKQLERISSSPQ